MFEKPLDICQKKSEDSDESSCNVPLANEGNTVFIPIFLNSDTVAISTIIIDPFVYCFHMENCFSFFYILWFSMKVVSRKLRKILYARLFPWFSHFLKKKDVEIYKGVVNMFYIMIKYYKNRGKK